ncbi:hypothetical protein [Pararhizobium gei]|uniref:hypothetical protein n=1 Tax=Pararhizobium gei TaxID=1395951 RepID=UPI0023DA1504|nr:hypothetical protein [Rhizobium gei]
MRLLSALLMSTALAAHPVMAAEISYEGAKQIEEKFTSFLPEKYAKSGLVKVRPGTTDYEIILDPAVFLKDVDASQFSISGLKPFLSLIRPLDDGTWNVSQSDSLDVKGQFTAQGEKTDFTYKIDAFKVDGIYDPEILYFKSANMSAGAIAMASKSPLQSLDAQFGKMTSVIDSNRAAGNTIDIRSKAVLESFTETIVDPAKTKVDIAADHLAADVSMNGLAYKPLQDMVLFVMDKIKADKLAPADQARLKELGRANLPMFGSLLEAIDVTNLKVATPTGTFGAENLRYTIQSNGLKDGAKAGFGILVEKPSIPPGLVPEAFKAALPETVAFNISLDNLNLKSGISYFIDNADFNADKPLTDAQSAEAGRIFLPGGAMTIRYDDVYARSPVYDVSLSGTTTVYPAQPERQDTEVTIYARDFDKTVSYLQDNAQAVPQFGQAAFVLLMVKGFAKQSPDGRQMWTITVDETKKVKINGQDLPFQQ